MDKIEELKNEIIERYNMSWEEAHLTDELGVIQACKDNFKDLVEKLIERAERNGRIKQAVRDVYNNKDLDYKG